MILKIFTSLFIILASLKSIFYGVYEIQQNNKASGTFMIILSCLASIFPIVIIFIY